MKNIFKNAAIAGAIGLILNYLTTLVPIPFARFFIDVLHFLFILIYLWGFKIIGEKYQNRLVAISALLGMIVYTFFFAYRVFGFFHPRLFSFFVVPIFYALSIGSIDVATGIGFLKLKNQFGSIAIIAGVLNIVLGAVDFLTVVRFTPFRTHFLFLLPIHTSINLVESVLSIAILFKEAVCTSQIQSLKPNIKKILIRDGWFFVGLMVINIFISYGPICGFYPANLRLGGHEPSWWCGYWLAMGLIFYLMIRFFIWGILSLFKKSV